MSYSFVLVHIGNFFYEYIIDCINQIKKFNNTDIYLIISKVNSDKVKHLNINIEYIEDLEKTTKHQIFNSNSTLNPTFRGGFWKSATERFFYVEDVILKYNLRNVFHMENDNLIYFNVSDNLKIFENNYNIAATFDNDIRCIPVFIYFKELKSISDLNYFILMNNGPNDMELLSKYKNDTNNIKNLPVIPTTYKETLQSLTGLVTNNKNQYSLNLNLFNSLFDAAAIGQYIGGVDPRNDPNNSVGFINESALYQVNNFKIEWKIDKDGRIPYLVYDDKIYKLNNLHIHSKKLKEFI